MQRFWTVIILAAAVPVFGQEQAAEAPTWLWGTRLEIRANYRNSEEDRVPLRFQFPPGSLPPGQTVGFEETVDAGAHLEVSLISLTLDTAFGDIFAARAKIDAIDLYDRNPTSEDRTVDADEFWIRFGQKPEGLALPRGTTVFVQAGKAPKIERQPVRLLESYGLASTAFNRFEDVQILIGGSAGTNLYWRAQASSGNPVFLRDPNALAGDNGIEELRQPFPDPELKSGFPIIYDAEVEGYFFDADHIELGGALGYRWSTEDQATGLDLLAFYYERELAEEVDLEGTFYGGDLDLLDGAFGISLPIRGNDKTEYGARLYGAWGGGSLVGQWVAHEVAGLERFGLEVEAGWEWPLAVGPAIRGSYLLTSLQPAARFSDLDCRFRGPAEFVAPSMWWDWQKLDIGVRLGLLDNYDLTIEHAFHEIEIPRELDADETLVTLRVRI